MISILDMFHTAPRGLSDSDIEFLISSSSVELKDKHRLRQILETDDDFREAYLGDEMVVKRLLFDKEAFLKVSPALYFEVLLRKTRKDLAAASHTVEEAGDGKVYVFDSWEVVEFLSKKKILGYLADMLASFTKVESHTLYQRIGKNIWRKATFSDLDIASLMRSTDSVDPEHRLAFFKRIADVCLFMTGVFPDYINLRYRYPQSGEIRKSVSGLSWSPYDYEREGRRFYSLAARHPSSEALELSDVFGVLGENFRPALKSLGYMATNYLSYARHSVFGL